MFTHMVPSVPSPKTKANPSGGTAGRALPGPALGRLLTMAVTTALALAAPACGKADGADGFRQGVPHHEDVTLVVPGVSTQQSALTASGASIARAALLGEQAELYGVTRDVTSMVNDGTVAVLTLVKTITEYPATSVGTEVAVWGPYTEPLHANTWRLTVNRLTAGSYHYVFEAKPRGSDDSMYLAILSGQHNLASAEAHRQANLPAYGSGSFVLDWDSAQMLPEHDDNVGKASFTYSRPSPTAAVDITTTFTQVMDKDTQMRIDAAYDYVATPGSGGAFQFTFTKNSIATTPALETSAVRSRWQESGAGRADVRITGGDLGTSAATVSECWGGGDAGFRSVYMTNSYGDAAKTWGAEADCAFAAAEYATQ